MRRREECQHALFEPLEPRILAAADFVGAFDTLPAEIARGE